MSTWKLKANVEGGHFVRIGHQAALEAITHPSSTSPSEKSLAIAALLEETVHVGGPASRLRAK
jgi:hypothetical protein